MDETILVAAIILLGFGILVAFFRFRQREQNFIQAQSAQLPSESLAPEQSSQTETFDGVQQEALALVRQGEKIEAIKRVRAATNWGLKEAKDYVDALALGVPPSPPARREFAESPDHIQQELRALLAEGHKIQAVKLVRDVTGWGLKQAKDYVDRLELESNQDF